MNLDVRYRNDIKYGELQIGDMFRYDGKIYIMTDEMEDEIGPDRQHKSVDLESGEMEIFGSKVVVQRYSNPILIVE